MMSLGIYWCAEAYQNWIDHPVLTTINTAGLPVDQVAIKLINFKTFI
jgi:hypothetical protein